ncbi:MAG: RDD family protein [Zoogloeaceae bacterium]|jgi:uncharacterized RDD family membrane protein YckC|nr:RDD family protein [Zoogloeaceae bacterium]
MSSPSFLRCLAALAYESLLLLAVLAVGLLLPYILLGALAKVAAAPWVQRAHCFILLGAYFIGFWLHGGQTLAMRTWRLKLIDQGGGRLRPMQALLRYLAAWPSVLFLGIGLLWRFVDPDKQFLHDRIAGTRLIRSDSSDAR